ncbi:unnamed protein product, partial [marine sediment metagenome]
MLVTAPATVGAAAVTVKSALTVTPTMVTLTVWAPWAKPGTVRVAVKLPKASVINSVAGRTLTPPMVSAVAALCGWNPEPVTLTEVPTGPEVGDMEMAAFFRLKIWDAAALVKPSVAVTMLVTAAAA